MRINPSGISSEKKLSIDTSYNSSTRIVLFTSHIKFITVISSRCNSFNQEVNLWNFNFFSYASIADWRLSVLPGSVLQNWSQGFCFLALTNYEATSAIFNIVWLDPKWQDCWDKFCLVLDFEIGTRFLDWLSLTQPSAEWATGSLRPGVLMSNLSGTLTLMSVKSIPYFLYYSKAVVVRGDAA